MADSLIANGSNAYYQHAARLTGQANSVTVLVEDELDVPFWYDMLTKCVPDKDFRVVPYAYSECDGTVESRCKGKAFVLSRAQDFGPNLIGCIDSDYDYILRNHMVEAQQINSYPYLVQTYSYSIENLLCEPNALRNLCIVSANSTACGGFDFGQFMSRLSRTVYPLVVWGAFLVKEDVLDIFSQKKWADIFTKDVTYCNHNENDIIAAVQRNVAAMEAALQAAYPHMIADKEQFERDLRATGDVTELTAWTHVRGHDLAAFMLHVIVKPVVNGMKSEQINAIRGSKTLGQEEVLNRENHYRKQCCKPEDMFAKSYVWHRSHHHSPGIEAHIKSLFA